MNRSVALLFSLFLFACAVPRAQATVTLEVEADRLNDSGGNAASISTLALIVADTNGDGLGTATAGSIALHAFLDGIGGDDLIVFRTDLNFEATPGVLSAFAAGLDFADDPNGNWAAGDDLYLFWFPTLTTASTNLIDGIPYGVISLGTTPEDGELETYTYVSPDNTGNFFGSSPIPPDATNTAANQTSAAPNAPEIALSGNGNPIADGSATASATNHTDFGSTPVAGGTVVRTFTITNSGTAALTITLPISITGAHAADFAVTSDPATSVAAGGDTTFQVTFDPSALGTRNATISVTNTDADENPFDFAISGTGANSAPTDIALTNASVPENSAVSTIVGALSATDPDGGSHTFTLVSGAGDTGNGTFAISGNNLLLNGAVNFEAQSSYSIRVRATDNGSATFDEIFTISITDVNEAPTALALSPATVAENSSISTEVGTFSTTDPDAGSSHTYSLESGEGSIGNSAFSIVGNSLRLAVSPDFETNPSYSIRVRTTDNGTPGLTFEDIFTVTITNVNEAPTAVSLTGGTLAENSAPNATAGILGATDPDADSTFTFSLVSGTGDTDNGSFNILSNALRLTSPADFEAKDSYSVRVRATDGGGLFVEDTFTITITDVNEAPTAITLDGNSLPENSGSNAQVGTLDATDPDGGSFTFALVDGSGSTDNASFNILGSSLRMTASADYETQNSFSIRIRVTDNGTPEGLTFEDVFTVNVTNVNEAPTNLALSANTLDEGSPIGTAIGNFSVDDVDDGDTASFEFVSGEGSDDNASFSIVGASLRIAVVTDFETKSSYSLRVRAVDSGTPALSVEAIFTVNIGDVDETPGDITLTSLTLAENNSAGATVGTFGLNDPSATAPVTFSLVSGAGSPDNASFDISSTALTFTGVANFEQKSSYSIRVRATDSTMPTPRIADEEFIITILDVNEAPSNLQLSQTTLPENSPADSMVGALSVDDPDQGDQATYTLVGGAGSTDNAAFNISGNGLHFTGSPDFEAKSSYEVRIQAADSGDPALTVAQSFVITISDVNETPVFTKGADQFLAPGTTAPQTVANWATGIDDGDSLATQALSFDVAVLSGAAIFTTPPALSPTGTLTYTLNGTPGTAELSVTLTDDDSINGTAAIESSAQTFSITLGASDITVAGNGVDIANGDTSPDEADDTSFGIVPVSGGSELRQFTITNDGNGDLVLGTVQITGNHPGDFTITQVPDSTVAPSGSTTLGITFDPTAAGLRQATVSIPSNDADENPFTFAISGTGGVPEILVEEGVNELTDGSSSLLFSGVGIGSSGEKTLRITNTGNAPLTDLEVTVDGPQAIEFTVSALTSATLAPQESQEFTVTFTPTGSGPRSATLQIASNDADENPFDLSLAAVVDPRDGKPVVDPGEEAAPPSVGGINWTAQAAGTYDGLLYVGEDLAGAVSNFRVTAPAATSTSGGTVSATVRLNRVSATLRGSFDATGKLVSVPGTALAFDLQLQQTTGNLGYVVVGTVTLNGVIAQAYLPHAPYSATVPVPADRFQTGPYTLLIPSQTDWGTGQPGGDGWATATLSTRGLFSVNGRLGDGTKFTETAFLSAEGELSLYAELYSSNPGKGWIGGKLTFRDETGSDLDGPLQWIKGLDNRVPQRERLYPNGFDEDVWAVGSIFTPPAAGNRALDALAPEYYNAELSLIGPSAPSTSTGALGKVLTWFATNSIIHYGPQKLSAKVDARNGSMTGSFFDPATRLRVSLTGAVFQKQNVAGGVFVNGVNSGAVRILPGTGFTYPGSEDAGVLAQLEKPASPANAPALTAEATFPTEAAGIYGGVLLGAGDATSGALESASVTATGAISASLWIEGVRYTVRGTIGQTIILADGTEIELNAATMNGVTSGYALQGTVTTALETYNIDAQRRPVHNNASPSPWKAAYTVAVCAPDSVDSALEPAGDGYGTLTVATAGTCTGLINLADGTRATLAGHIGSSYDDAGTTTAIWSFHRGLYGRTPKGYVAGKLTFRNLADVSDVDGQWRWVKQSGAAPTTVYAGGFDTTRDVIGSAYTAPLANTRAMAGLNEGNDNVWIRFAGTDLSTLPDLVLNTKDLTGTWQLNNAIIHYGPQTVRLAFNPRSGLITGSYRDTANGINFAFGGVLIKDQDLVTGRYLTQGQSGRFVVEKR